ncbi:hypothetical protein E2C01_001108 [Portunus trituberculatus]|uniref:Secreted protein n=1 Tax=Portunus trituberculatus TaxID=210409 RepID=A0A5B7CIF7_PORTR|nr:hypothetical protein [Portunus trituberculatus]
MLLNLPHLVLLHPPSLLLSPTLRLVVGHGGRGGPRHDRGRGRTKTRCLIEKAAAVLPWDWTRTLTLKAFKSHAGDGIRKCFKSPARKETMEY